MAETPPLTKTSSPLIQLLSSPARAVVYTRKSSEEGAVRLLIASIRLMGQSKFMHSLIDAPQPEQRHGSA
jgi:hypothetical protein